MALILGIETSCDETAAGVVADGRRVISNVVASQVSVHAPYGGVVPELASREHDVNLIPVVEEALAPVNGLAGVDAVAVTVGPGLQGCLLIGLTFAKAITHVGGIPLYGVNHLEGHVAALRLIEDAPDPPFVCLLATGGHTALYDVKAWGEYRTLGETVDDAVGEAFDKVARLLGLSYPGGPAIERAAAAGDPDAFKFPRPMASRGLDFSFAGLKTAVALAVKKIDPADLESRRSDVAASFENAAVTVLTHKAAAACKKLGRRRLAVVGGVAANARLRRALAKTGVELFFPPLDLCGDNGAMVAAAAFIEGGATEKLRDDGDVSPSWTLPGPRGETPCV